MITTHGIIAIEPSILAFADTIKLQNYKTNTPKKFQIQPLISAGLIENISRIVNEPADQLDVVYFSVCKGAEPHVDLLDPDKFKSKTFVIPIILPEGESIIIAEGERKAVCLNEIYEFNHEKTHSMELEDTDSGCVVIMVAVKH